MNTATNFECQQDELWANVHPLECVILCCCTVVIFLPRSFIFSKPLLTKKFLIYYGSVKQTWQECSLYGFRSIWKFNMTLEPIMEYVMDTENINKHTNHNII
jgi:hypothetical protein